MAKASSREGYESVRRTDEAHNERAESGSRGFAKMFGNGETVELQEKIQPLSSVNSAPSHINDTRTFLQKCNSYWAWELLACLLSMACLGVVIRTLVYLDERPIADWKLSITPASFISTFVTVSRFLMLVGVAEGVAQLRWLYYLGGPRRLDHLDSFDSASRGPWGSFLFACRHSIRGTVPAIARMGAIVTIIALAMDPFAQQIVYVVQQPQNRTLDDNAWMLATTRFDNQDASVYDDASKRRVIYGGLVNVDQTISFGCETGNCTFSPFNSLGYCISCKDIADSAIRTCVPGAGVLNENCTAIQHTVPGSDLSLTLRNGSASDVNSIDSTKAYTLLQSNTTGAHPEGFQSPVIFSFFMAQLLISKTDDTFDTSQLVNPSWNLTTCSLGWCSKVYEGLKVTNGTFSNNAPTVVDIVSLNTSTCFAQQPPTCQEFVPSDAAAVPQGDNTTYYIAVTQTDATIRNFLIFDHNLTVDANNKQTDDTTNSAYNLATGLFWNLNLTTLFDNLADSLTDFLRASSSPQHVKGTLIVQTLYTKVHWHWFALPALMVLFAAAFLIWVIVYTAQGVNGERLIWKGNTIPLLMHGLEGYHRHGYAGAESTGAIFRKAKEMTVQLRRNDDGEIRFIRT